MPRILSIVVILNLVTPIQAQEVDAKVLDSFQWRALGPTATGGRIVDIAVHPTNPHQIYAASASGGLWKTINNGTTWECIFQNENTLSIGDVAIDPQHPETLWIGTGEANNQRSSLWGDGIYKSTDDGKTWKNMGLADTQHIGRIVVHPTNSDIVYVAALGHLYTFNEDRGLYKTEDGGKSWKKVLYINEKVGVVDVVIDPKDPNIVYAASYQRLRRAWNFDGAGPGSAIYKSNDGGKSWKKLSGGLPTGNIGRIGLDIYPPNPKIVYATVSNQNLTDITQKNKPIELEDLGIKVKFEDKQCVIDSVDRTGLAARSRIGKGETLLEIAGTKISSEDTLTKALAQLRVGDVAIFKLKKGKDERVVPVSFSNLGNREVGGEVYRTDDGGNTWNKRNDKSVGGSPAYYYGQIRVDPNNEQRVYMLGVPMYVSDDGGKTWSTKGATSVHVDHHALWINPKNSNHILLGNDGGFHISYDKGKTWDYVYNLPLTQFYAIGADMQKPYHVYGGTQDNGTHGGPSRSRNPEGVGRFDWIKVGGGDGFYVQIDPKNPNLLYLESQFGVIQRVDLERNITRSIRPPQSDPNGPRDRFNWNSPILMSQFDSRVIYFGGNKLFKTYNQGDDWQVISPDLTTADPAKVAGNVPYCTITTIAESPKDRNMLLVGTDDGNVQWTNDGGKTWVNMADRFPVKPPSWWCSRVEMSHHNADVAYVAFTGYREDDFRPFVFVTRDKGATWQSIVGNLGEITPQVGSINVIKEDPKNPNLLYVGSEFGVYVSFNGGKSWQSLNKGLPRVSVHDLLIHPRDRELVIGTHGRGFFVMDIAPMQEMTDKVLKSDAHVFSVPNTVLYRRVVRQDISGDRKLYAPNPPSGATISYYLKEGADKKKVSLRIVDDNDKTVAVLKTDKNAGFHQVNWNLRKGGGAPDGGRRGGGRRFFQPTVSPGRYVIVLTVDDKEYRTVLILEPDPLDQ